MADRRLVGTTVAAREVGVHYGTLSRWAKEHVVKEAERTAGGQYRWDVDDLRRQLQANQESTALDPLRAAYDMARAVITGMDDLHAALTIVGKLITLLQDQLSAADGQRLELVKRIYEQDGLALKPLADRVSISEARARREGR